MAGLGLGRFGLEGRLDVSGLEDSFDLEDVSTYQTLEAYASAHWVAWAGEGVQLGPAVFGGMVVDDQGTEVSPNVTGFGFRLATSGGELFGGVAWNRYLRGDSGPRAFVALHFPIAGELYVVGDLMSGDAGFVRAGVAYRVK